MNKKKKLMVFLIGLKNTGGNALERVPLKSIKLTSLVQTAAKHKALHLPA